MDHIWAAAHRPKKSPGLLILEQLGHYFRSVIMEDPVELAPSLVFVKIKLIYGGYVPKTATLFGVKLVGKIYGI